MTFSAPWPRPLRTSLCRHPYRATGVILHHLSEAYYGQLDLFGEVVRMQRLSNLYESVDTLARSTASTRCSWPRASPHISTPSMLATGANSRNGRSPCCSGETSRKRLGIPLFLGEVQ